MCISKIHNYQARHNQDAVDYSPYWGLTDKNAEVCVRFCQHCLADFITFVGHGVAVFRIGSFIPEHT